MPKINVYLPGWLADAVRGSTLPVSAICQQALTEALAIGPGDEHAPRGATRAEILPLLTNRAREVLRQCGRAHLDRWGPSLAMLAGIAAEGGNLALVALGSIGVGRDTLVSALDPAERQDDGHDLDWLIERAASAAADLGDQHVGCEHLLLALVADPAGPAAVLLSRLGAEPATIRTATSAASATSAYVRAGTPGSNLTATITTALGEIQARLKRLERR
jgi:ATP-dependent Clp protease ATP-binding subunit ClpC